MWCKNCNVETNEEYCPICGEKTIDFIPTEVYWCDDCQIPVIQELNESSKGICPICGGKLKYLATDVRPVFPEERMLLEILLKKKKDFYINASIWASSSRYYINGKSVAISGKIYRDADCDNIAKLMEQYRAEDNIKAEQIFYRHMDKFVEANKTRLNYLIDEAHEFVRKTASKFEEENIVLSFSGGKDSTVTADIVIKALSNPSLVHIFGNTTLEFPTTIDYAKKYREEHPYAIFKVAKNNEQVFLDVCEDIGPPARMMRWCCSMFKTGPITRVINGLYRNKQILTFYGIRRAESASRSKYNRVEDNAESVKIQQQTVASPIFFWNDVDIWLYLLSERIEFNDAYKLGYDRVGCWCCPNNTQRAQFLSRIYMPEQSKKWRELLINFAKKVGKPDPEEYVDSGKWKARQGGNGLAAANDVKIRFTNCTTEEYAKIYRTVKPMDEEFLNMLTPFGRIAPELGNKLLKEVLIIDIRSGVPILSVQPFNHDGYDFAVKVRTLNVEGHDDLQHMVGYQIRKFNACRKCLKCESLCKAGAISISADSYYINPDKCVHCKMCVTAKYLRGGCMMDKYLRTKD